MIDKAGEGRVCTLLGGVSIGTVFSGEQSDNKHQEP